jgi:hypothetical protein
LILERATGFKTLDASSSGKNILINEKWFPGFFSDRPEALQKLSELKSVVEEYNKNLPAVSAQTVHAVPVQSTVLDLKEEKLTGALSNLIQIQMYVLQNEREMVATR